MTKNEEMVRKIVSKILKNNPSDMALTDDLVEKFGMDSMQRVEVVIELEKAFDTTISDETALGLRSIERILQIVNGRQTIAK